MLCIIQARMSSSRLPGKMLMQINKKPLLQRVIDRVSDSKKISKIIVATSLNQEDNQIENYCNSIRIQCYRGDLNNVVKRYMDIIENESVDAFVRISGDSPLIPPEIIDKAVICFENNDCDIVTNVFPRTYPKGFSVEVISSKSFAIKNQNLTKDQKEHITKKYYDNSDKFKIINFESSINYGEINLSVDTINDLNKIINILSTGNETIFDWKQYCNNNL
ncbi:NTP transferase domain-containing protein [Flavobacteriaceae bacterium]|nr:NTP transferase domain-containing protein [Flavobacteriaceae bacterium]